MWKSGPTWSSTYQPTLGSAFSSTMRRFSSRARAEFLCRQDGDINTHTEIAVTHPKMISNCGRITLTNQSRRRRAFEITSYSEVVIAAPAADAAHPAFGNLFVQTEILPQHHAILCTRRPRSAPERPPWMFHLMAVQGTVAGAASYETDRSKFIGRAQSLTAPAAIEQMGSVEFPGALCWIRSSPFARPSF